MSASPQHVLPAIDHLLHLPPLPHQLQAHQARLVLLVLEARLAAGDHVILVISQLQGPVDPHRHRHTPLLSVLGNYPSLFIEIQHKIVSRHQNFPEGCI